MCRHFGGEDVTGSTDVESGRVVLPKNVKPVVYHLTLEPNFETFEYDGKVDIDLDVIEDTTSVSLNTIDIKINSATITCGSSTITDKPDISYDRDIQTTKISFADAISAGSKAKLSIAFTGTLNDNMAGFYRSSYKAKDGTTKYMASTQMEPTDARRAFPCFDEPALKAKFIVTLIADKHMTCLSNMDAVDEKEVNSNYGGKRKAVTFRETPLMSTYLLAFIIGELNVIETDKFRVPVRVYATPDQNIEHGRFSVELAARTLEFYEQLFDSKFPLPKMDMIAVPDFSAGAMENWGLVTYRTVDLLLDEKNSGAHAKQLVAEVVQHELAHQWFGNLVTMDFWDGLWLNEGFATWMSWYSCNIFYPEWKIWESYVTDNLASALSLDSLRSSHPIEVPVKRAEDINQIFDAISYSKGSSVLRMISKYLGEDTFLEGVRRYLKKHAYGNTKTTDLWAALSDASGKDVESTMAIWTKKVGYPVLTVTEDASNKSIHVKQNRFLRTADVKPEEDETLYPVFIGLRTRDGVDESLTLAEREGNFKLKDLDFYKLNADHSGLYRTSYSTERLEKLGEAAKQGLLTVEDRAGMIADAGALAAAGYQKTSGLLSLLTGFKSEPAFVVWSELLARVGALRSAWMFESEATAAALKKYQLDLCAAKAHEIGWEFTDTDGHVQQQFKALLFGRAGMAGDEKIIAASFDMLKKLAAGDRTAVHPNLRAGVFGTCLTHGGATEYDAVLEQYRRAPTDDERLAALVALGRAQDPRLIARTLELALSAEVKNQDIVHALYTLASHRPGVLALWSWFRDNWAELERRLPPGLGMLGSVVSVSTSSFTRPEHLDDVKRFFAQRSTKGFDQIYAQALDSITAKMKWVERDGRDVEDWLRQHGLLE